LPQAPSAQGANREPREEGMEARYQGPDNREPETGHVGRRQIAQHHAMADGPDLVDEDGEVAISVTRGEALDVVEVSPRTGAKQELAQRGVGMVAPEVQVVHL